jgi:hypothetical protein
LKYQFDKLKPPQPGCSFGRYWAWSVRLHGRWLFKNCIQGAEEDFPEDVWWTGNDPDPLP